MATVGVKELKTPDLTDSILNFQSPLKPQIILPVQDRLNKRTHTETDNYILDKKQTTASHRSCSWRVRRCWMNRWQVRRPCYPPTACSVHGRQESGLSSPQRWWSPSCRRSCVPAGWSMDNPSNRCISKKVSNLWGTDLTASHNVAWSQNQNKNVFSSHLSRWKTMFHSYRPAAAKQLSSVWYEFMIE